MNLQLVDMFADFLSNYGTLIKQIAIAVLIFLAFLLLRKIFITYIFRLLLKITKRTTSDFDNQLVMSFEKPMRVLIIILGIYFALAYLPLKEAQDTLLLDRKSVV